MLSPRWGWWSLMIKPGCSKRHMHLLTIGCMMLCIWSVDFRVTVNTSDVSFSSGSDSHFLLFCRRSAIWVIYINCARDDEARNLCRLGNSVFWFFENFFVDGNTTNWIEQYTFILSLFTSFTNDRTLFHMVSAWAYEVIKKLPKILC